MTVRSEPSVQPLTFTPEEQRRIHEQWVEMHMARYRAIREKYAVLESQIQQIARHVGMDPKDLEDP